MKQRVTLRRISVILEEATIDVESDNPNDAFQSAFLMDANWNAINDEILVYGKSNELTHDSFLNIAQGFLEDKNNATKK
jgi:hypothetical protein